MLQIPLSKARATSHEWAYLFATGDAYRRSPEGEPMETIPGTECRNTGCCDMNGRPIFEHDYVKKWAYIEHTPNSGLKSCVRDITCEIGEILYIKGVLCKHIEGLPDTSLPYQYLHDPQSPLMLCFNEVIGNSMARRRPTFRKTDIQLAKERKPPKRSKPKKEE